MIGRIPDCLWVKKCSGAMLQARIEAIESEGGFKLDDKGHESWEVVKAEGAEPGIDGMARVGKL